MNARRPRRSPRTRSCAAPTPAAWVEAAVAHWPELLIDHANCEKKAASTALALMFAYPEDRELCVALARLAREELRHFEQVLRAMRAARRVVHAATPRSLRPANCARCCAPPSPGASSTCCWWGR